MKLLFSALLMTIFAIGIHAQQITPDLSFGTGGTTIVAPKASGNSSSENIQSLVELPDSRLLTAMVINGTTYLARFNSDGSRDLSYGVEGLSNPLQITDPTMARRPDGKIIVAGRRLQINPNYFGQGPITIGIYLITPDGTIDNSFGSGGLRVVDFGGTDISVRKLFIDPDGSGYLLARNMVSPNLYQALVLHLDENGNDLPSFGGNSFLIIAQPSLFGVADFAFAANRILVALTSKAGNAELPMVLAFTKGGQPDYMFGSMGTLALPFESDFNTLKLAYQPDDRILVAGSANQGFEIGKRINVLRYNQDGSFDKNFNSGMVLSFQATQPGRNILSGLRLDGGGSIYLNGTIPEGSAADAFFARIKPQGTFDSSFGTNGIATVSKPITFESTSSLLLTSTGLTAGGYTIAPSVQGQNPNTTDYLMVAVDKYGSANKMFGAQGVVTGYFPSRQSNLSNLNLLPDGSLIARYNGQGAEQTIGIIKFYPDGSRDDNFGTNGVVPTTASHIGVQPDGSITTIESILDNTNRMIKTLMCRYTPQGQPDLSFGKDGKRYIPDQGNYNMRNGVLQPDGKWLLLVQFINEKFQPVQQLIRVDTDGSINKLFGQEGAVTFNGALWENPSSLTMQEDGRVVVTGQYDGGINARSSFIKRLNHDGSPDITYGTNGVVIERFGAVTLPGICQAIKGGKLLVNFITGPAAGPFQTLLVRYNADGTRDGTFANAGVLPNVSLPVTELDNGKLLLATRNESGRIGRFNADGSLDASFGDNGFKLFDFNLGPNSIETLLRQGNKIFVTGRKITPFDRVAYLGALQMDEGQQVKLSCLADTTVATEKGTCSAVVKGIDPILTPGNNALSKVSFTLSGATSGSGTGTASGTTFNKGATTITYTLDGTQQQCSFTVTVQDKEAPVITGLRPSVSTLSPANHKLQEVSLQYNAWDNCGMPQITVSVTSNEAVSGAGSGNTTPDFEVLNNHLVRLRAERNGTGSGRVYTITVTATDAEGNQSSASTTVTVPKDNGSLLTVAENALDKFTIGSLAVTAQPNPSSGQFTIRIGGADQKSPATLIISDLSGKVMETYKVAAGGMITVGSKLAPGLYILQVKQNNATGVKMLVKIR